MYRMNGQSLQPTGEIFLHDVAGQGDDAPEESGTALTRSLVPLFDAYWQGRLIPGAQIESLPFIEVSACSCSSMFMCQLHLLIFT